MCYRANYTFSCGHTDEVWTKCRSPLSNIIPKRCLATFKLPETKEAVGNCHVCSIKETNATREAEEKKIQKQFEQAAAEAKMRRTTGEKMSEGRTDYEDQARLLDHEQDSVKEFFEEMEQSPLAELD